MFFGLMTVRSLVVHDFQRTLDKDIGFTSHISCGTIQGALVSTYPQVGMIKSRLSVLTKPFLCKHRFLKLKETLSFTLKKLS